MQEWVRSLGGSVSVVLGGDPDVPKRLKPKNLDASRYIPILTVEFARVQVASQ